MGFVFGKVTPKAVSAEFRHFKLQTSTIEDRQEVKSMAQSDEKNGSAAPELSESLKKEILDWCRRILSAALNCEPLPPGPALDDRKGGVFVTLNRLGQLRGCIGRFDFSALLADSIQSMILAAAFEDPRFPPLSASELGDLEITVSILTEPKPLKSLDDIVIGRDGLYLLHPHGRGVLLPVVALEMGWNAKEFARHTSIKAGLSPKAYEDPRAQLLVFTAPAFSTSDLK
jgi:AmmeMemoRadiSam system protein A